MRRNIYQGFPKTILADYPTMDDIIDSLVDVQEEVRVEMGLTDPVVVSGAVNQDVIVSIGGKYPIKIDKSSWVLA